jgi:hypothetical protein
VNGRVPSLESGRRGGRAGTAIGGQSESKKSDGQRSHWTRKLLCTESCVMHRTALNETEHSCPSESRYKPSSRNGVPRRPADTSSSSPTASRRA